MAESEAPTKSKTTQRTIVAEVDLAAELNEAISVLSEEDAAQAAAAITRNGERPLLEELGQAAGGTDEVAIRAYLEKSDQAQREGAFYAPPTRSWRRLSRKVSTVVRDSFS